MTDRELLQFLLDVLDNHVEDPRAENLIEKSCQLLRTRLAQPEPEPDSVVWDGMTKQPEALRLADGLQKGFPTGSISVQIDQAAAELRRLHEVNAELVEALQQIIELPEDSRIHYKVARRAIAKATGEQQ